MNNTELNASDLNGAANQGNNLTVAGGISSSAALVAGAVITAILTGGITTRGATEGAISTVLKSGVSSSTQLGGKYRMTINLIGGVISSSETDSLTDLGFAPSLHSGVFSPVMVGGQIKTHVRLQPDDQVGQRSTVSSNPLRADTAINGGISKTAYVGGGIRGSTVLMADGVKSSWKLDSNTMKLGREITGGVSSPGLVGGKLFQNAKLQGGMLATWELGKEIDIEAILRGGVMCTHDTGGNLRISPVGNGGLHSTESFSAKIQLSPAANGGVYSTPLFDARYRIQAKLPQGVATTQLVGGKGITASQILRGGVSSVNGYVLGGQLRTNVKLQGIVASPNSMGGDIVQGFLDPMLNTWALEIRSATPLLELVHPTKDI